MSPLDNLGDLDRVVADRLAADDAERARLYPGERSARQPVHTVYVPADVLRADTVPVWGRRALVALDEHAPEAADLPGAFGLDPAVASDVHGKIRRKLAREPVEDLRVDFEDGYGVRPDAEEDDAAVRTGRILRDAVHAGTAPPSFGIRFKSLEPATRTRGLRTLDLVLGEVTNDDGAPAGFVVTLAKVTSVAQVAAMVLACDRLEAAHRLPSGSLRFEIQVETPQAIVGADGAAQVAPMIHASAGRCAGLHYGTYDYSASLGIAAQYQAMDHPAADHAKSVMQVAAAGTGVWLSDGSTNVIPDGDTAAVRAAWRLHSGLVRRSLERGFYQGWDMHPAQLPSRFATTFAFYLTGLPQASARLRAYVGKHSAGYLDEPATAAALAGFVVRALECGAVEADQVTEDIGLRRSELERLARRTTAAGLS